MSTSQVFKDASKPFVQTKVNLILPPYLSIHSLNKYLCSTCSMPGSMLDLGKSRNGSGLLFCPQRLGKLGGKRRNIYKYP